jgi:ankyrin repeat protein/mono/diheme cytochrome c family protein
MRASVAAAIVAGSVVASALTSNRPAAQTPAKIDFVRDVQPIFRQHCIGCHGPTQQMNGFRLDRRRDAMRGGTIPVIGPGNSVGSRLYLRLAGERMAGTQMPPTGALKPEQVAVVKAWIDQGAEWPDEAAGDTAVVAPDPIAQRLNDALRQGDRAEFTAALGRLPTAVRAKGLAGITPLMSATLYGDVAAMQALISSGADVNARNEAGATALMWAVTDLAKTQLLVEHGAEVDVRSPDGRTPLMIAAGLRGSAPVVKLLLAKGASPSTVGPALFGITNPLNEAAFAGDAAVFGLLVDAGADLKAGGPFGLAAATLTRCESCATLLIKASPPPFVSIAAGIMAPPFADGQLTRGLVEQGADVNGRDPEGRPLIVAVASSDRAPVETMQALLARGVDVHAKGPNGETALDAALQRGQTPLVELLLKAGAQRGVAPSESPTTHMPANSPRAAIARSLPLLQRTDATFLRKAGCVSCHNNALTAMTIATARQKGLPIDRVAAAQSVSTIGTFLESWRERALQNVGIPGDSDTISYILLGLAAENYSADAATDAMARFLETKQLADGRWEIVAHRPPIESSSVEVTAASMRALQVYAPRVKRATFDQAIQRAATWLKTAPVATTEDRAFQMLGLGWANAGRSALQAAGRALIAEQRADGGWAQLATLPSDAYATGQALVALAETGAIPPTDPVFQRGVQFLLQTQLADGSWFVRSRAIPFQPQFDADFPHRKDSWISAAATNWATRALVYAVTRTN